MRRRIFRHRHWNLRIADVKASRWPLRKDSGRIFYEISSCSVLPLECQQKTRLGKLTYLAYFLVKMYYSYACLRSYSSKYVARSNAFRRRRISRRLPKSRNIRLSRSSSRLRTSSNSIQTLTSLKSRRSRIWRLRRSKASHKSRAYKTPAEQKKADKIRRKLRKRASDVFYSNRTFNVYRSRFRYQHQISHSRAVNRYQYRRAFLQTRINDNSQRTATNSKDAHAWRVFDIFFGRDSSNQRPMSSLLRRHRSFKHQERNLDEAALTRATWAFYSLRRRPVTNVVAHYDDSTLDSSVTAPVPLGDSEIAAQKTFQTLRRSFLPVKKLVKHRQVRQRIWRRFTKRFSSFGACFKRIIFNFLRRPHHVGRRHMYPRVASRVLHSFLLSKQVTVFTYEWPRLFVFLFHRLLFKLVSLYIRINYFFSVVASLLSFLRSMTLYNNICHLRCYTNNHGSFLSCFSSLVFSSVLSFQQCLYANIFFTGFSRSFFSDLRSTYRISHGICQSIVSAFVFARFTNRILYSLRTSLLQLFFVRCVFFSFFEHIYISYLLTVSLKHIYFFLLHKYVSGFFLNKYDSYIPQSVLRSTCSFLIKNRALTQTHLKFKSIYNKCTRSIRHITKNNKLKVLMRRSSYVRWWCSRAFRYYRRKKKRSRVRKYFLLGLMSVFPFYMMRNMPIHHLQQMLNKQMYAATDAHTVYRAPVAYVGKNNFSTKLVRRGLRRSLLNMFSKNRWVLRFFPAFKGARIIKYFCTLFTRTAPSRRNLASIRNRVWYIINQHARNSQRYARSARKHRTRLKVLRKKNAIFRELLPNSSKRMRMFSLSYFLRMHYNMQLFDFIFFCKYANTYTGSVASILLLFERTIPIFLSNHFMINNGFGVRINNLFCDPTIESRKFISIGDIIEFSSITHKNIHSIYSPLFVILFHIISTSIGLFFRSRLLSTIVTKLTQFSFKRRQFIKGLRLRDHSIPVVGRRIHSLISDKSVSYFIKSRATSHTHMLKAIHAQQKSMTSTNTDLNGRIGFLPFAKTVIRTNKEYVSEFLGTFCMNGFWTIPDSCLQVIKNDIIICNSYALFWYNIIFTRHFFNGIYISGSVDASFGTSKLQDTRSLLRLPVFFYTNFTRFVLETPFFRKPDVFLYNKRYFTFYCTALLTYKRNAEMSHFDKTRVYNRLILLDNVKRIQKHIRVGVTHHNSIRSIRKSITSQARFFSRVRRIFHSGKYRARKRMRKIRNSRRRRRRRRSRSRSRKPRRKWKPNAAKASKLRIRFPVHLGTSMRFYRNALRRNVNVSMYKSSFLITGVQNAILPIYYSDEQNPELRAGYLKLKSSLYKLELDNVFDYHRRRHFHGFKSSIRRSESRRLAYKQIKSRRDDAFRPYAKQYQAFQFDLPTNLWPDKNPESLSKSERYLQNKTTRRLSYEVFALRDPAARDSKFVELCVHLQQVEANKSTYMKLSTQLDYYKNKRDNKKRDNKERNDLSQSPSADGLYYMAKRAAAELKSSRAAGYVHLADPAEMVFSNQQFYSTLYNHIDRDTYKDTNRYSNAFLLRKRSHRRHFPATTRFVRVRKYRKDRHSRIPFFHLRWRLRQRRRNRLYKLRRMLRNKRWLSKRSQYRRRRFFGTSFHRTYRRVAHRNWRAFRNSRRVRRLKWRLRFKIRRLFKRSTSSTVLPLFDKAETTVRMLNARRYAAIDSISSVRSTVSSSRSTVRRALAASLLGRYLRERLSITTVRRSTHGLKTRFGYKPSLRYKGRSIRTNLPPYQAPRPGTFITQLLSSSSSRRKDFRLIRGMRAFRKNRWTTYNMYTSLYLKTGGSRKRVPFRFPSYYGNFNDRYSKAAYNVLRNKVYHIWAQKLKHVYTRLNLSRIGKARPFHTGSIAYANAKLEKLIKRCKLKAKLMSVKEPSITAEIVANAAKVFENARFTRENLLTTFRKDNRVSVGEIEYKLFALMTDYDNDLVKADGIRIIRSLYASDAAKTHTANEFKRIYADHLLKYDTFNRISNSRNKQASSKNSYNKKKNNNKQNRKNGKTHNVPGTQAINRK